MSSMRPMNETGADSGANVLAYAQPTEEIASLARRSVAGFVSASYIFAWMFLSSCFLRVTLPDSLPASMTGVVLWVEGCAIVFAVWIAPFLFNALYSARHEATLGMRPVGLKYRSVGGDRLSGRACFFRTLVGTACLPLLPVSIVIAMIDRRNRSVADLLCRTTICAFGIDPRRQLPPRESKSERRNP